MSITYHFEFEDHSVASFLIDPEATDLGETTPAWTDLEHCQCANCPLSKAEHKKCPVAVNLYNLVDELSDSLSYERAKVTVRTETRDYFKETDLQSGLFSLMGLLMANSDCPHFEFLAPLAKYHLPFSTVEETIIRSTSFYLLRQHLNDIKGYEHSYKLDGLQELYGEIEIVNKWIAKRIQTVSQGDASKNALVCLNGFAQLIQMDCDYSSIESIFS